MSVTDDIHAAMVELRELRQRPARGRALYELNIWKGEERRKLDAEYERRLAEIEAAPEVTLEDSVSPKVLGLVGKAVAQGVSRSNIRKALGKSSLSDTDEIIALASGYVHEQIQQGEIAGFSLRLTGQKHSGGWPMYAVTLLSTGETHEAVYLVTTGATKLVERRHLRIAPAPAGSAEILDAIFESGAASEMFQRGK